MSVRVQRTVRCVSSAEKLWPVIADTERTNRAVGMDKVIYRPLDDETAARFLGETSLGGFSVTYEERPFEWVYPRYFRIVRRMRSGPIGEIDTTFSFAPREGGTDVTIELRFETKSALLSPILKLRAGQSLDRFEQEFARIDRALVEGRKVGSGPRYRVREDSLRRAEVELKKSAPEHLVARLCAHLTESDDVDLARLRPFALADEWGEPRASVLSLLLRAVQAGLLEMRWEVVCPSCRVGTESLPTLSSLREHGSCQLCEITFDMGLDEALEAVFTPSAQVREVDRGPYCIGGPGRVPHVLAQAIMPPLGEASLVAPSLPGRYRVFVRGGHAVPLEVSESSPTRVVLGPGAAGPLSVTPGGAVVVKNEASEERHAKIEKLTWSGKAATAREVTALSAFRRDFSSDVLRPGSSLKVSRVALFFSDLTASTQLYSRIGDAAAFKLVQDHFDVVLAIIERRDGALVKTIGDAVMAVFASDLDGLAASLEILQAFERFRREGEHRSLTHIKLGLYAGPCFVVTANKMLDYFGQSVNIAARLQAQADSGELVITRQLCEEAIERKILPESWVKERYLAKLKGVDGDIEVARVAVAGLSDKTATPAVGAGALGSRGAGWGAACAGGLTG